MYETWNFCYNLVLNYANSRSTKAKINWRKSDFSHLVTLKLAHPSKSEIWKIWQIKNNTLVYLVTAWLKERKYAKKTGASLTYFTKYRFISKLVSSFPVIIKNAFFLGIYHSYFTEFAETQDLSLTVLPLEWHESLCLECVKMTAKHN